MVKHPEVISLRRSTLRVASQIRRYCASSPDSADTFEGIVWWVTMQCFAETSAEVQEAVEFLVSRGFMRKHEMPDGRSVYACGVGCPPHEKTKSGS